jgi:hypothetical protein
MAWFFLLQRGLGVALDAVPSFLDSKRTCRLPRVRIISKIICVFAEILQSSSTAAIFAARANLRKFVRSFVSQVSRISYRKYEKRKKEMENTHLAFKISESTP